jgi:TetR/AcrR family transcriptional regulator, cholesterol catabolism regulator
LRRASPKRRASLRRPLSPDGHGPGFGERASRQRCAGEPAHPGPGPAGLIEMRETVFEMRETVVESTRVATSTREQLVRAAARLFREQGFHGTSVAEIASAAWITKSSLYHHFASKQALLAEILTDTASRVTPAVEAIASADLPAADRLRAAARCHVVELIHDQDMVACFVEEGRFLASEYRDDFVAARDRYEQSFRRILQDGIHSGEFRPVSVRLASLAVLGMCNSVVHWYQPSGDLDVDAVAEQFADLAVRSLLSGQTDCSPGAPEAGEESLTGLHIGGAEPEGRSLVGSKTSKTVSP